MFQLIKEKIKKVKEIIKEKFGKAIVIVNSVAIAFLYNKQVIYGSNGTERVGTFITFVCEWLLIIGGVVAMVGAVMFALGWQREDAEGKTKGLLTLMAGFMVIGISQSPSLFGL